MGQGSRGGNGGLTASGGRIRKDKEAAKEPKKIPPGGKGGTGGTGGKGGKGGRGRRGGLLHGGHGLHLPHPGGSGSKGSSGKGSKGKKGTAKHTPTMHMKAAKVTKMPKLRAPKEKLTKQRTNKTPN